MNIGNTLIELFKKPDGMLGILAGIIMASRSSNIERNEWTLGLLKLQPTDRVLEIGFGPGVAIKKASETVTNGMIIGIDHSKVMLKQASKRNAIAIRKGTVILHLGTEESLPTLNQSFNKIYSTNVVQFWRDPVEVFRQLRKMLTSDGIIATTYMPRPLHEKQGGSQITASLIVKQLTSAGFSDIRVEEKMFESISTISVLAFNTATKSTP